MELARELEALAVALDGAIGDLADFGEPVVRATRPLFVGEDALDDALDVCLRAALAVRGVGAEAVQHRLLQSPLLDDRLEVRQPRFLCGVQPVEAIGEPALAAVVEHRDHGPALSLRVERVAALLVPAHALGVLGDEVHVHRLARLRVTVSAKLRQRDKRGFWSCGSLLGELELLLELLDPRARQLERILGAVKPAAQPASLTASAVAVCGGCHRHAPFLLS